MKSTRHRHARNALVLGLLATFATTATGCFGTGRFRAMNTIYDFNKGVSDNGVVRSLVMIGLLIIPVYEISFLVDAIVLNTMDFFNGGGGKMADETLPDGTKLMMAKVDADTVRVRHVDLQGKETSFDVVRVGDHAGYVRAADGRIVGNVEKLPDGRLLRAAP
ncbi:MAG: hypothetical protein JWM82_3500 [Myxococcales bacterium]|nr:hypothetical protein [Myxococcales bacterium]